MYHLLPIGARHHFSIRKSRHYAGPQGPRLGFESHMPKPRSALFFEGGVKADHHRTTRRPDARHGGLLSPSRHDRCAQEPSDTGNSVLLLGVPSLQVSRNQKLARFGLPGLDNNLTPLSYPNAGPDTEAGLVPVGPLECLSPCRRDARVSG